VAVDLPLAVPVVAAGLRVAAVSNVSIVSIASLVGVSQLGQLFTDGFNRNAMGPIVVGVVACVVLALMLDALIALLARLVTPWLRRGVPA
jgi:osmoprotectant transport system permease protein